MKHLRIIRFIRSRSQPHVIVKIRRYIHSRRTIKITLAPHRTVCPQMNFPYVSDHATLDPFDRLHSSFNIMPLVTHLGNNTGLLCQIPQKASLINRLSHRLLYKYMLTSFHRISGNNRMGVVRSTDQYRIDLFLLVDHFPEIGILFRFRVSR